MPRKQNGFGNSKSLGFKGSGRIDKGKGAGSPGLYPGNRRYGSSIHRTIIEKYNLDSDWTKWRKGYEYYNQAAWYRLQDLDEFSGEYKDSQIKSKLYQGTPYEIDVVFDGYKFATKGSDSNNHYVMKRTTSSPTDLGLVTGVLNDAFKYPEYKANREIRVEGTPGVDARLLFQMIGERLTDGETEATLNYILNSSNKPGLYIGKSNEELTQVIVKLPINTIQNGEVDNAQDLVGKIVWIKNFFVEKDLSEFNKFEFTDSPYFFEVTTEDKVSNVELEILDPTQEVLPPSLYDISDLPSVLSSNDSGYTITGKYLYKKDIYQKYFGKQYLTGDVVKDQVSSASYGIFPFTILGVNEKDGFYEISSIPFISELKMYSPPDGNATLVFTDYSFTKLSIDEYNGEYYHKPGKPGTSPWMLLDTDVDPWMDEVFTAGNSLRPATVYTCSCPNHSHAVLRAPQASHDEGTRKTNRQRRYPLPTVMGRSDFNSVGLGNAAGLIESWETRQHRMGVKLCKHSIASMFINRLKVKEPNTYPTSEAREDFEEKLRKEIQEVGEEFGMSYKRGGITTLEIIFALAQGLNLDDVELAYVMLNSNF